MKARGSSAVVWRQQAVNDVLHGLGAGLPNRWAYALVDAWEQGDDVFKLRRDVSSIRSAITATDDTLRAEAKRAALQCGMAMRGAVKSNGYQEAVRVARRHAVDPAKLPYDDPLTYHRAIDSRWWLLQIRKAHAETMEAGAIRLGMVHRFTNGDCYASRETVRRRRQQRKRNQGMLNAHDVENDLGESLSLADVAAASVSNKSVRRNELMIRLRGYEEIANELGHKPIFVTITCPSRFHRVSGNVKTGVSWVNKNYLGQLPREAQDYLVKIWSLVRSEAARLGVQMYGFRVCEPHHDGCPHWHMLLWVGNNGQRSALRRVMSDYFLRDTPDEPGAKTHRVRFVYIKPWLGAVGYIAKYIAKNVDGFGVEEDLLGNPILVACEAVDAWASAWRIRQFQPIGGPPVQLWRELRRIDPKIVITNGSIEKAIAFVHKTDESRADFAGFVRVMGGPIAKRCDRPIELVQRERYRPTRYGDRFVKSIVGLVNKSGEGAGVVVETRARTWRLVKSSRSCADLGLVSITVGERPKGDPQNEIVFQRSGGQSESVLGAVARPMRHSPGSVHDGEGFVPSRWLGCG